MDGMSGWRKALSEWKYVLLVAAVGLALLLLPSGSAANSETVSVEEQRLEALLGQLEGVGEVRVLLSEQGAAVVCEGADSPQVCLEISQVLRCYGGLGADRVRVFKMK